MSIIINVIHGDITFVKADVVILKFAREFYGADAAVASALADDNEIYEKITPELGEFAFIETGGKINAEYALFIGVKPYYLFQYREIRNFMQNSLQFLSSQYPECTHIAMTIHGVGYGLNMEDSLLTQLDGICDALKEQQFPNSLEVISIIEKNERRSHKIYEIINKYFKTQLSLPYEILLEKDVINGLRNQSLQNPLINDLHFWRDFIISIKPPDIIETTLWDFKQTLDMWEITDKDEKEKAKIRFCEHIISFANNRGGVIIVGISDKDRKIIGIDIRDLEDRVEKIQELILRMVNYNKIFVSTKQIKFKDENGHLKNCLLLIIAQTKRDLAVKINNNDYRYKIRLETGKYSFDPELIRKHKKDVHKDNYYFLYSLKQYIKTNLKS